MSRPSFRRWRSSVPEIFRTRAPFGTSSAGTYRSSSSRYTIIWKGTIVTPISASCFLNSLLRVIRTVERFAVGVFARTRVIAAHDEVRATVVFSN